MLSRRPIDWLLFIGASLFMIVTLGLQIYLLIFAIVAITAYTVNHARNRNR